MCFFFKQKTAYEMRISDWSSDVCSSDLCILIGESRDLETMSTTIDAALTGHTVYTTLHTNGVAETIQRVTGMFPDSIRQERVLALLESPIGRAACKGKRVSVRVGPGGSRIHNKKNKQKTKCSHKK